MTEQTKERIEQLSSKLSGDCHNNSKSFNLGTVLYKHAPCPIFGGFPYLTAL